MSIAVKPAEANASPDADSAGIREPQLFNFSLKALFGFVALVAATFALLTNIAQAWQIVVGSALALIAAHVLGTVIGTRLRDASAEIQRWKTSGPNALSDSPQATPQPVCVAELALPAQTPLAFSQPILRRGRLAIAIGMSIGTIAGLAGIYWFARPQVTWPGLALGSVSCGVIGAWASMLAANFWSIARHAVRQASADEAESRRIQR